MRKQNEARPNARPLESPTDALINLGQALRDCRDAGFSRVEIADAALVALDRLFEDRE